MDKLNTGLRRARPFVIPNYSYGIRVIQTLLSRLRVISPKHAPFNNYAELVQKTNTVRFILLFAFYSMLLSFVSEYLVVRNILISNDFVLLDYARKIIFELPNNSLKNFIASLKAVIPLAIFQTIFVQFLFLWIGAQIFLRKEEGEYLGRNNFYDFLPVLLSALFFTYVYTVFDSFSYLSIFARFVSGFIIALCFWIQMQSGYIRALFVTCFVLFVYNLVFVHLFWMLSYFFRKEMFY